MTGSCRGERGAGLTEQGDLAVLVLLQEELAHDGDAAGLGLVHGGDGSQDGLLQRTSFKRGLLRRPLNLQAEERRGSFINPLFTQDAPGETPRRTGTSGESLCVIGSCRGDGGELLLLCRDPT